MEDYDDEDVPYQAYAHYTSLGELLSARDIQTSDFIHIRTPDGKVWYPVPEFNLKHGCESVRRKLKAFHPWRTEPLWAEWRYH
jgi:hypothetical protein